VAGVIEVVAVIGQDARRLFLGIVLLPVLDKRLAQVVDRYFLCLGDLALDGGELLQLCVVLVGAIAFRRRW